MCTHELRGGRRGGWRDAKEGKGRPCFVRDGVGRGTLLNSGRLPGKRRGRIDVAAHYLVEL